MRELNINGIVAVQLSFAGEMRLSLAKESGDYRDTLTQDLPDGWKKFQLWQLMKIFGSTMPWHSDNNSCFASNIKVIEQVTKKEKAAA